MRELRWQLFIVVLALVAIGLLLLGQQLPSVQPYEGVRVPQPIEGGIYTEGLIGSFGRLNPLLDFYNPTDRDVDSLLFSSLVQFDTHGVPLPDLAESWGISQDGTVYNLSIRQDAVWHDGESVTSDDVIFTISLLKDPGLPIPADTQALWEEITVESLDDNLLQFRLPEPFAPFLDYLTFGILPSHLLGGLTADDLINDSFNLQPIGSGPYRFDQLLIVDDQITGVVLTAFEAYYHDRAFIDNVVFRYYPDAQSALDAYRGGEIIGIGQVTSEIILNALQEPNLNLYTGRLPQMTIIFLNLNNPEVPFFQDHDVREALLLGMNRQWMIDQMLSGQAIVANGPIFPGTWAYYDNGDDLEYDSEKAIALLKSAEYMVPAGGGEVRVRDDDPLTFTMLHPSVEPYARLAQAIRQNWAQLGVQVELQAVPYETLVADYLTPGNFEAVLVNLNLARSPDPYPFWHQSQITGGQNYAKWDDRPASEYLEQARIVLNLDERALLYRNFQVRFAHELPSLPLFYPVYTYGVGAQVLGVRMGPIIDPSDRLASINSWFLLAEPGGGGGG